MHKFAKKKVIQGWFDVEDILSFLSLFFDIILSKFNVLDPTLLQVPNSFPEVKSLTWIAFSLHTNSCQTRKVLSSGTDESSREPNWVKRSTGSFLNSCKHSVDVCMRFRFCFGVSKRATHLEQSFFTCNSLCKMNVFGQLKYL